MLLVKTPSIDASPFPADDLRHAVVTDPRAHDACEAPLCPPERAHGRTADRVILRDMAAADLAPVTALHRAVFGPGRFARSAYRLREQAAHTPVHSVPPVAGGIIACVGGETVGAVHLTCVRVAPVCHMRDRPAQAGPSDVRPSDVRAARAATGSATNGSTMPKYGQLLGPLLVESAHQHRGIGQALVEAALLRGAAYGLGWTALVGDAPYYGRLGFIPAPGLTLPGPVDPARVLIATHEGCAPAPTSGALTAAL
ncbi:MAG: N-acetyltransferase [Pseudomonadota bacterium]